MIFFYFSINNHFLDVYLSYFRYFLLISYGTSPATMSTDGKTPSPPRTTPPTTRQSPKTGWRLSGSWRCSLKAGEFDRIIHRNGEEKWVWERGRPVDKRSDGVVIIEGFINDITARKLAETALIGRHRRIRETSRCPRRAMLRARSLERIEW